jgi:Ca2+-binding EF-hand superfamily protein
VTKHSRYKKVEGDGKIGYDEFANKLYNMPANEERLLLRATQKLMGLKEGMILYMTSASDAFRMFSKHKKGFLTFKEFETLLKKVVDYSQEKFSLPAFSVIKDMFDAIDIGKDGLIDFKEWTSTF